MGAKRKIYGGEWSFAGYGRCASRCHLEVYRGNWDGGADALVVATQINDPDAGTSVTNAAEILINDVCCNFDLSPERLIWVEHYKYPDDEHWDLVGFCSGTGGITNVKWTHLPEGKFLEMVKGAEPCGEV
jgi:hypothetical protein